MAEERWSAFIAGLIYELDLLDFFFIEWITAYPTSSCVNSCVQGEGKKNQGQMTQSYHSGHANWILNIGLKVVPLAALHPVAADPGRKTTKSGHCSWEWNPLPGQPQLGTAVCHMAGQPPKMLPSPCSLFVALPNTLHSSLPPREQLQRQHANQALGTMVGLLKMPWDHSRNKEELTKMRSCTCLELQITGPCCILGAASNFFRPAWRT